MNDHTRYKISRIYPLGRELTEDDKRREGKIAELWMLDNLTGAILYYRDEEKATLTSRVVNHHVIGPVVEIKTLNSVYILRELREV